MWGRYDTTAETAGILSGKVWNLDVWLEQAVFPLIIIGVLIGGMGSPLVNIGLILFSLAVIFQLITLPVELNASRRAITLLDQVGILGGQEVNQTRRVLGAAALTYVAALAASVLQLLRLVILFGGRRDND